MDVRNRMAEDKDIDRRAEAIKESIEFEAKDHLIKYNKMYAKMMIKFNT